MNTFEQSYDYIYNKIDPVVQEDLVNVPFAILLIPPFVQRCHLSFEQT